MNGLYFTGHWIGISGTMDSHSELHLEHLPWPISVLTFNGAVNALRTGDDMTAILRDPDVVGNLCQLLGNQPNLRYEVRQIDTDYCIQVFKGCQNREGTFTDRTP
jgi:hypothetical protein